MEKLPEIARDMVASRPDAIMGVSGAVIEQLKAASGSIPIVMSFSDYDPVSAGFVASFAHPGGNITGIAMMATVLDAKRLNLLHEAVPAARRIAVLAISEQRHAVTLAAIRGAAAAGGIEIVPVYAPSQQSYPEAFGMMRAAGAQSLVIVAAPELFQRSQPKLGCRPCASGARWRCAVACLDTVRRDQSCGGAQRTMSSASCVAHPRLSFRSKGRRCSSSPSISRPRGVSESCRQCRCFCARTKSSNDAPMARNALLCGKEGTEGGLVVSLGGEPP